MGRGIAILVVALVVVSLAGLVLFYFAGSGGAGRGFGAQNAQSSLDQRSLWLFVFAVPLAVALVVAVYAVLFPQIKVEKKPALTTAAQTTAEKSQTLEAVMRVLNADEQKVINALGSSADGAMLQKDIRWKAGLSRVKTHRVLARLAARGIVKAEKYYNTNRIVLADWIANDKKTEK
jgi:uncharacterized membrane protein